ncbi:hypothetical protein PtB15_13B423 [Puccinia triticina]|nr:hypothetical protein PtB15_13B423 [Puccinia triticina]
MTTAIASLESLFSNATGTGGEGSGGFGSTFGLDFFETQLVESQNKTTVEDVNDDLKIEVELYKNALEAAQQAVRKFESNSKPFFRPPDYFAEMIKSDAHMETIRLRLVEEAEGLKASEEAKKKRELKKFGKAIQVENKLQREKEAKRMKEGVKELRKKRKDVTKLDGQDEQEFDIAVEETLSGNPKKRAGGPSGSGKDSEGRKKTRTAREHKFGRPKPKGVTGRRWKENTKSSASSFEGMGGTLMVVVLGIVTDWSIRLIALNSKMTGQRSYIGILEQCFGFPGKAAVSFFQFIFAFGGMCAFGVIVGDTIPPVLSTLFPFVSRSKWFSFLFSRSFVITFFTITVSYPLSLYRDIGKLSKASAMALLSMVMIVFSVALGGPSVDPKLKGNPSARWTFIQPGIVEAIGVISFAFVCHHNSLLIYGSLRTPTLDRFAQVTHVSTALSVIACLVMSFSGFLTFTDRTEANILNNFPRDDLVINIARVCFGLNMFTTLPLECFVCRETIDIFFYPDEMFNLRRHVLYTTLLVGIGMLLSLWTCDLGVVLELTGGLAASALAYVFPAACQLKLSTKSGSIFERENWAGLLTVAFGLGVMAISTVNSLSKALDPNRVPKVCL